MLGCIKYFHLPPIKGRKVFKNSFLIFIKKNKQER